MKEPNSIASSRELTPCEYYCTLPSYVVVTLTQCRCVKVINAHIAVHSAY